MDTAMKALASSHRREVVRLLSEAAGRGETSCRDADEVCACKLSEWLELAPSTISHHMAGLREAGLVRARKDGTWVYYSLDQDVLAAVAAAIRSL